MRLMTIGCSLLGLMTLFAAGTANAQSSGAFQPYSSAEAPFISRAGWGVYNTDTTATHMIIADYEVATTIVAGAGVNLNAHLYGNGNLTSCNAFGINLSTLVTYPGTPASNSNVGTVTINFGTSLGPAGTYAITEVCTLGKSSTTNGNATLFGVDP
jgi:hypothetical protein